jgi:hypothetical protein
MSIGRASETTPPAASKVPSTHLPKDYPERRSAPSFAVVSNTTRSMLPSSSSCLGVLARRSEPTRGRPTTLWSVIPDAYQEAQRAPGERQSAVREGT